MADRTSAELFGKFFSVLAEIPTDEHKRIATELLSDARNYDFNYYQMYCDDALVTLGLAGKQYSEEDECERMFYGPPGRRTQ